MRLAGLLCGQHPVLCLADAAERAQLLAVLEELPTGRGNGRMRVDEGLDLCGEACRDGLANDTEGERMRSSDCCRSDELHRDHRSC